MNKQIGKNMFDGMELPEQTKQEVWGNLESIIEKTCLGQTAWKSGGCIPYNGSSFRNY